MLMEDSTKRKSSSSENKTEIKGNTTGGSPKGDSAVVTVLASHYRIINLVGKGIDESWIDLNRVIGEF